MNLRIGNLEFENPFFMAPLAGVSDSSFRRLCREQGAAMVYSEMISAKGLCYNDKATERLLRFCPEESPLAYQIFGSEPDIMKMATLKLTDRSHCLMDINMGCPVPKVVKNGEGSALMRNVKLASELVKSVVAGEAAQSEKASRHPRPVTVKCRIGWDASSICAVEFAKAMEEAGAEAICIHGRTREQYYSGKADWESIARVKEAVDIPVIGNGDVFSGKDAMEMLEKTKCDFVMIARGALGNPWIFRDAITLWSGKGVPEKVTVEDKISMMKRHARLAVEDKGESVAVKEMRKHVGWYLKGVRGATQVRREANTALSISELLNIVDAAAGLYS